MAMTTNRRRMRPTSFTLIELLVVIALIAILSAIILAAGKTMLSYSARSRAQGEIAGFSQALDNYKVDNAVYPVGTNVLGPPSAAYVLNPTNYQTASHTLYTALSGQTNNFTDTSNNGNKNYYQFKANQLGNLTNSTYVEDPFGNSYGYSTGDGTANNIPYSGSNMFDLWSTGGTAANTTVNPQATNSWINNWTR
jgi:prepilin-type N-terminal cleavage/methylation domain-containing protein